MYNEVLNQARVEYIDAAIAEITAVANVIDNADPQKAQVIMQRAQNLGETAQQKYWDFIQLAKLHLPDNPALQVPDFPVAEFTADEN